MFILLFVAFFVVLTIVIVGLSLTFKGVGRPTETTFSLRSGIKFKRK
jgi:hypothetical protein